MFGEELIDTRVEAVDGPELDEKTPHFLNPEILADRKSEVDVAAEEFGDEVAEERSSTEVPASPSGSSEQEQLEAVLNQGLGFLDALSRMATGKSLIGDTGKKAIEIDHETGEVVLRFKIGSVE